MSLMDQDVCQLVFFDGQTSSASVSWALEKGNSKTNETTFPRLIGSMRREEN